MTKQEKQAIGNAVGIVERLFGSDAIMRLGEIHPSQVETISSGFLALDKATGIGGFPVGGIIEIFGWESTWKTSLALHLVAEANKLGEDALFIDAEHTLTESHARNIGVDPQRLWVHRSRDAETAFSILRTFVGQQATKVIVVDSVAALIPQAELKGSMGEDHSGTLQNLLYANLRQIAPLAKKNKVTIVFLNQLRERTDSMYGTPFVTVGGNALKFYSSLRIQIGHLDGIGSRHSARCLVVKNSFSMPYTEAIMSYGIDPIMDLVSCAYQYGVLYNDGFSITFGDKTWESEHRLLSYLQKNPGLADKLRLAVRTKMGLH